MPVTIVRCERWQSTDRDSANVSVLLYIISTKVSLSFACLFKLRRLKRGKQGMRGERERERAMIVTR
jgi:hypothetical protein